MNEPQRDRSGDGSGVWLEVVAAVDHLCVTTRFGFTVWDALEEALRWWTAVRLAPAAGTEHAGVVELPWDDPDPLRSTLERVFAVVGSVGTLDGAEFGDVLTAALEAWVERIARVHNDGHVFAHPVPRRGWPSPTIDT